MRRLFSTFAHGAPGAGLLLMRMASGGALVFHGAAAFSAGGGWTIAALHLVCAAMGVLLIAGLWTPIVASVAAIAAALHAFFDPADATTYVLLAALAASLALLGPGVWSVDARLFGWRRIEIRDRNGRPNGYSQPPD